MSTFWPHNRKAFLKQDIKNVTIKKVWQFYYTKMLKFGSTTDTTRVRKKKKQYWNIYIANKNDKGLISKKRTATNQ